MTKEIHTIILKGALRYLLEKSDKELLEVDECATRKEVEWCLSNPVYPDTEIEAAMKKYIKETV